MAPKLVEWYVGEMKKSRPIKPTENFEGVAVDSRFPNQNQTRHCYQMYLDYHRCVKKRGDKYEPCNFFKRTYNALCPQFWTEKWNEQIANDTFAGQI